MTGVKSAGTGPARGDGNSKQGDPVGRRGSVTSLTKKKMIRVEISFVCLFVKERCHGTEGLKNSDGGKKRSY